MPQLSYPLTGNPGQPGQLFDNRGPDDIVQIIAGAVIPAGVFCEAILTSGQYLLFPLQDASLELIAGTVSVTNASPNITFSQAQTILAGTRLTFASQAGVVYILGEDITAGTAGVLDVNYTGTTNASTTASLPGASYGPSLIGVSVMDVVGAEQGYQTYQVPNAGVGSTFVGYPKGRAVPVCRKGRIWTLWDGSTSTPLPFPDGSMNVIHSSTGANPQGVVTTKAPSTTAGFEIDPLPACCQLYDPRQLSGTYTDAFGTTTSMVVMSLNLPGK